MTHARSEILARLPSYKAHDSVVDDSTLGEMAALCHELEINLSMNPIDGLEAKDIVADMARLGGRPKNPADQARFERQRTIILMRMAYLLPREAKFL